MASTGACTAPGTGVAWPATGACSVTPAIPLLLLHGFAASSGHWRHNVAGLAAAGWCVYGLDLIGFGGSDQPALHLDNRLWARQSAAFLQQVVQQPAVLLGHSLGGWWP